jgi:hypothetical protein
MAHDDKDMNMYDLGVVKSTPSPKSYMDPAISSAHVMMIVRAKKILMDGLKQVQSSDPYFMGEMVIRDALEALGMEKE